MVALGATVASAVLGALFDPTVPVAALVFRLVLRVAAGLAVVEALLSDVVPNFSGSAGLSSGIMTSTTGAGLGENGFCIWMSKSDCINTTSKTIAAKARPMMSVRPERGL